MVLSLSKCVQKSSRVGRLEVLLHEKQISVAIRKVILLSQ